MIFAFLLYSFQQSFCYSTFSLCFDNDCIKSMDIMDQTKHMLDNAYGAYMKNVGSIVVDIANTIALHDLPNRLAIIPTISLPRKRSSSSNGTYTCYENIYM